jgi:Zn-dependent protease
VAVAGPAANLLMALLWGLAILLGQSLLQASSWFAEPLIYMGAAGVLINVILMVLNLLPIPPLDGSRVITALLPLDAARNYVKLEPYGLFIVVGLLVSGILGRIMFPLVIYTILLLPGAPLVIELFFK